MKLKRKLLISLVLGCVGATLGGFWGADQEQGIEKLRNTANHYLARDIYALAKTPENVGLTPEQLVEKYLKLPADDVSRLAFQHILANTKYGDGQRVPFDEFKVLIKNSGGPKGLEKKLLTLIEKQRDEPVPNYFFAGVGVLFFIFFIGGFLAVLIIPFIWYFCLTRISEVSRAVRGKFAGGEG